MKSEAQEKADRLHRMLDEVLAPMKAQMDRMEKELSELRKDQQELKEMLKNK